MAAVFQAVCVLTLLSVAWGDTYMHNPRGSNNRLNEQSANRNNGNRMFDSQNNNRGGYNVGDQDDQASTNEEGNYYMKFFQSGEEDAGTYLTIEWTNQHGCGGNEDNDPHKLNCNMVIQYMVQDYDGDQEVQQDEEATRMRDGENTNTQNYQAPQSLEQTRQNAIGRRDGQLQLNRGLHEPFEFYDDCYVRERNEGLFTADQRLRTNDLGISAAIYTRQNPNGNRRGYECPEERDYYPYWHPTPWRDIAVLTDNTSLCDMYQTESFNVQPRQHCRHLDSNDEPQWFSTYNNEEDCVANDGEWFTEYAFIDIETSVGGQPGCNNRDGTNGLRRVWAPPRFGEAAQCLVLPNAPECQQVGWTRVNHLGNSREGVPLNYTWRLPFFPSQRLKLAVLRIRYNISTDDYDPWFTDSNSNEDLVQLRRSPVEQNPYVDVGSFTNKPLRLAINTAQFGRTFQDRSHVMELRPRTELSAEARTCQVFNLNVRGKRGNIVQVYPAVEYDFVPNRLTLSSDQCLHVQWTGSNRHNNGAPGGDGQTGDAGEGTGGTDRSNIVEALDANSNYPLPWENATLFKDAAVLWSSWTNDLNAISAEDLAVAFTSSGHYQCHMQTNNAAVCTNSVETGEQLNQLLNNAPASFEGALLRFPVSEETVYYYFCSRNNNFTNRSQKGQLTIVPVPNVSPAQ